MTAITEIQKLELHYQMKSGQANSSLFIDSLNLQNFNFSKYLSFSPIEIKPVLQLRECLDFAFFAKIIFSLEVKNLLSTTTNPEIIKEGNTIYVALSSIKKGFSKGFISPDSIMVKDGKTYVTDSFLFNYYGLPEEKTTTKEVEVVEARPAKQKKPTKTYLLKDTATNTIKFGASMRPHQRERTLHSEKPTMKLIAIYDGKVDHVLKKKYKHLHVRGEWYMLGEAEINEILTDYSFTPCKKH
jgi:hypothetical protein